MRIEICHTGKTREPWIQNGEDYFLKKTRRFTKIGMHYISGSRASEPERAKREDSQAVLKYLEKAPKQYNILLDERGKLRDSIAFARHLEHIAMHKGGAIRFISGGPYGVTKDVVKACDESISISPMVFTHELIRLILLEQVYRAFTILRGESYHHQ